MTFINVEPYKMEYTDGRLQPVLDADGQLQITDATRAWGILSEPWIFVVDRRRDRPGIVRDGRLGGRAQGGDRRGPLGRTVAGPPRPGLRRVVETIDDQAPFSTRK